MYGKFTIVFGVVIEFSKQECHERDYHLMRVLLF